MNEKAKLYMWIISIFLIIVAIFLLCALSLTVMVVTKFNFLDDIFDRSEESFEETEVKLSTGKRNFTIINSTILDEDQERYFPRAYNGYSSGYVMVCSGSMVPTLHCGDKIHKLYIKEEDDLYIGDIVGTSSKITDVFPSGVLHRIVEYDEDNDCYITKGDANSGVDSYCWKKTEIKYKVIGVDYAIGFCTEDKSWCG